MANIPKDYGAPTGAAISKVISAVPTVLDWLVRVASQQNMMFSGQTEVFGTTYGARNWKPFVIGLIPPDRPVNFFPVKMGGNFLPKPPPMATSAINTSKGNGQQAQKYSVWDADNVRKLAYDEIWRQTGQPPSETVLGLLCSQIFLESGRPIGWYGSQGFESRKKWAPPNNNPGAIHAGPGTAGADKEKVELLYDPTTQKYIPQYTAKQQNTIDTSVNKTVITHNKDGTVTGTLLYASLNNSANKKFYDWRSKNVGKGGVDHFIDLDYSAGVPYFVGFRAYATPQDGIASYVNTIARTFPGALQATDVNSFIAAQLNGRGGTAYFDKTQEQFYADSIQKRLDDYQSEYGDDPLGSQETTPNSTVMTMAYGVSTTIDDPLQKAYGRNIAADESRATIALVVTAEINAQIQRMANTPALGLIVNPREFRRGHENIVDFGTKGRTGHIVHTWLEHPIKISASGITAAQYAMDAELNGGLTNLNRVHSLSYMNLMSLVLMYKNNGMVYGSVGQYDQGVAILPAAVFIYYDDHVYIGSFDDFSITDSGDKPHNLEYSFKFNVRYDAPVVGMDTYIGGSL